MLLTTVEYLKPAQEAGYRNFAIVDAAMNDLIRPALYRAYHSVEPVQASEISEKLWNIAGPICETGDFLALDRNLGLEAGTVLAVKCAGACGFSQSSNYNTRPRAPEMLIDGGEVHVIGQRETFHNLVHNEQIC